MKTIGAILGIALLTLLGCDEYERISGAEFKRQYDLNNMQTVQVAEYLGTRDSKAFMEIRSMSTMKNDSWTERIVYAELSELDDGFRDKLLQLGKEFSPAEKRK